MSMRVSRETGPTQGQSLHIRGIDEHLKRHGKHARAYVTEVTAARRVQLTIKVMVTPSMVSLWFASGVGSSKLLMSRDSRPAMLADESALAVDDGVLLALTFFYAGPGD